MQLSTGQIEILDTKTTEEPQDASGVDFGTTFNLGITERQRQNKEEVVLPHFAAMSIGQGTGEASGSIEYTLDAEDDFDDEEDVDEDLLI
jgi:elongator complex protein 5